MSEAEKPDLVTVVPTVLIAPLSIHEMPEGFFWTRDRQPNRGEARDRLIDMVVPGISDWMDRKRVMN